MNDCFIHGYPWEHKVTRRPWHRGPGFHGLILPSNRASREIDRPLAEGTVSRMAASSSAMLKLLVAATGVGVELTPFFQMIR